MIKCLTQSINKEVSIFNGVLLYMLVLPTYNIKVVEIIKLRHNYDITVKSTLHSLIVSLVSAYYVSFSLLSLWIYSFILGLHMMEIMGCSTRTDSITDSMTLGLVTKVRSWR